MTKALLYDSTLCIGCRACEKGCAQQNGLPYDDSIAIEEKLSAHKVTAVTTHGDRFMRKLCMNCLTPTCVSVCPVAALQKSADGPVTYDASRCMGCRYCMMACPFQVPAYEWDKRLPVVRKCNMCADRVTQGLQTACAEICPTGATKFGDRDALIAEARQRISANPGSYYEHIYGIEEVGGTSVLLLAAIPFPGLGVRADLPRTPMPLLTWHVLSEIPNIVTTMGVLLGGIWWLTHRRTEVAAAERAEEEAKWPNSGAGRK
jgi:formate dehydrogenase iron-sulfur subunit